MKAPLHVICRAQPALGIALAGIAPTIAATGAEAAAALQALHDEPGHGGVVLIEQALHDALPASARRQIQREGTPIVMTFPSPGPAAGTPPEHELLELLRRAIGYRVRLR